MYTRRKMLTRVGVGAFGVLSPSLVRRAVSAGADGRGLLAAYPALRTKLRQRADDRARALPRRGGPLRLAPADGAYVGALTVAAAATVETGTRGAARRIAPDGLLTFAIDVPEATYVRAALDLEPDADRRPGLRAYLLSDDTLVAAPMQSAPEWGIEKITDPAPRVAGGESLHTVRTGEWLLPAGRHYLTVAGPHFRPAGTFTALTLTPSDRPVETPLYRFALITDTHLRHEGRPEWMNVKMGDATPAALRETLRALAEEGVDFALHGGDMTEGAVREEFALLAGILKEQPLPFYGCMGNHDVYHASSRPDALELLTPCFPGAKLDYVLDRKPVRFVVLDETLARPERREERRAWLRETLKADTTTPTVVTWHFPFLNRGGPSSCGFRLEDWSRAGRENALDLLREAPNVVATLNGHAHWDEVNRESGVVHIQNAAFVEWPNSYRVFRVYPDRMEWEVRQVANRGFVRESCAVKKAVSWMIATRDADLTGVVPFAPSPNPSPALRERGARDGSGA